MTSVLARDGALMPAMRAPFSFSSRSIAINRNFDSTTSRRKSARRLVMASPRGSAASMRRTLSCTGVAAAARGIDADRAAMARDRPGVEDFEIVHLQKVLEAGQRIVAQVLMVDRVVLQRVEQADEIMRFGDEYAAVLEHLDDAVDDRVHVLDMGEAICGGDHAGRRRARA